MNNKKTIAIVVIIVLVVIAILGILVAKFKDKVVKDNKDKVEEIITNNNTDNIVNPETSKSIVVYFSATGTTEKIAFNIKDILGADIVKIVPEEEYTSEDLNYTNSNSRVSFEHNNENVRPKIQKMNVNFEKYDTVYLGYPIWWSDVPKVILTFLEEYDLTNVKVVPFCTSVSSGITSSEVTLKKYISNKNLQSGKRFGTNTTYNEVKEWLNNI